MPELEPSEPLKPLTPQDAMHALRGIAGHLEQLKRETSQILRGFPPAELPQLFAAGYNMSQQIGGTVISAFDMLNLVQSLLELPEAPDATLAQRATNAIRCNIPE